MGVTFSGLRITKQDSPDDHALLERDFDGPGLPSQLAVHLDDNLGGDTHQTLRLAEHRGRDALTGHCVLDAALGLHRLVMLTYA